MMMMIIAPNCSNNFCNIFAFTISRLKIDQRKCDPRGFVITLGVFTQAEEANF